MRPHRPESLRCIARIVIRANSETGRGWTRGWQVRVIRRGISITEFYSDSKFGGRAGALSEAMHYRDEVVSHLRPTPRSETIRGTAAQTASGIVGVRRTTKKTTRNGQPVDYPVWEANGTPEPNKRRLKYYSVPKLGEEVARERAIAQRLRWEKQMKQSEKRRALFGKV